MIFEGHGSIVYSVSMTNNSREIYSAEQTGKIYKWSPNGGGNLFTERKDSIYKILISRDGHRLFVVGKGKSKVAVYDTDTQKLIKEFERGHTDSVFSLVLSHDDQTLYTGGADYRILGWNANSGELTKEFMTGHAGCVQDIVIARDDINMYSAGRDGQINRWSTDSGKVVKKFDNGHSGWIGQIILTKNGLNLYSAGGDKTIVQWKAEEGKVLHRFEQKHSDNIYALALSPDEDFLLSGGGDSQVFVWDLETRSILKKFIGHKGQIRGLTIDLDFKFFVSCSRDQTVRLWKIKFLSNYLKIKNALKRNELKIAKNLIRNELESNNSSVELHEYYRISGKYDLELDNEIAQKILENFGLKVNEFKKEHDTNRIELRKQQLLFQLEKCYDIFTQHNHVLRQLYNNKIDDKNLSQELEKFQQQQQDLQELQQFKKESQEKIAQLKQQIEENEQVKEEVKIQEQLDNTYNFFHLQNQEIFKTFKGEIVEGLKEGQVSEETYEGVVFEGNYKRGKRDGPGLIKHPNYIFEGSFKNDRPLFYTGTVNHIDEEGNFEKQFKDILNYIGEFKERKIDGKGTIYFRNGGFYEGSFSDDEINGAVTGTLYLENEDGNLEKQECSYGFFKQQFLGKFTTLSKTFTCDFKDGLLNLTDDKNSQGNNQEEQDEQKQEDQEEQKQEEKQDEEQQENVVDENQLKELMSKEENQQIIYKQYNKQNIQKYNQLQILQKLSSGELISKTTLSSQSSCISFQLYFFLYFELFTTYLFTFFYAQLFKFIGYQNNFYFLLSQIKFFLLQKFGFFKELLLSL